MRRLLLILACAIIVVALVAPALLVWSALFTTSGLQFVVRHIPRQLGEVRLTITGVSGTVADGVHVGHLEIDHRLVNLQFDDIAGRVTLMPLMLQTIRIAASSVGSARIQVKRRTQPPTPEPPVFVPRWLILSVEDARVGKAQLNVFNGFHMEVRDLRGAAVIRHSYIRIFQADAWIERAHLSASGELGAADPLKIDAQGRVDWMPEGQPNWMVSASGRGDLNLLNISAHTLSPFRAEITGQMLSLTDHWHWMAEADVQDFNLSPWLGARGPLGSITGHVSGSGDDRSFSAHGPLTPHGLRAGVFAAQFTGHYAAHVLTATQMEVRHVASGARASAAGTFTIIDHGPRLDLGGSWSDFRWPLVGRDPAVRSAEGAFVLSGVLPYEVRVSGRARAAELPEMTVELTGTLGKDDFSFDPAAVALLGGRADASGRIAWSPTESWSVSGRATDINPGILRADLPGAVSFAFGVSGRGFEGRGDMTAAFSNLSGKLRGVPASGSGTLTHAGTTWGFSGVRIELGTTSLALDGHISERLDLRVAVATHDLSLLAPGSRGELRASGTVNGTFADPVIVGSAHGSDFEYRGVTLGSFDADVNFNPEAAAQESKVDVRLHELSYRKRTLEGVVLRLNGLPADYEVQLAVNAAGLAASVQARGAYTHGVFRGQLRTLSVAGTEELNLALERPVDLTLSLEHARIEWLCMTGTPGSLCADGDWTPAAWSATVMANELPLATLTTGMTPAVEYLGTISTLARVSGGANTPLQGMLRAQLADAAIAHKLASHKVEHTRIGSGTIFATATPVSVSAQIELGDSEAGTLHGELAVQRTMQGGTSPAQALTPWPDMPLSGELHAQTSELSLLTLYAPDIDRAAGSLTADVGVSGTLGAPALSGTLRVSNAEIDVYQVNLVLRRIALEARFGHTGLDFTGSAQAGTGEASASGHMEWRNLQPYGKFHLQGTSLRVADLPEAQIDASPDLDFTVTGRRIAVLGKVAVPYARIQPKDITTAVRASPDETIVGSEVEDPSKRFEVVSTITLALGEKVNLDAMGLTARLAGSVTVSSGYDAITRGSGELSVAEGTYTAYARKLDIERGRLIFTGGPIDDPGIDVRATKAFPDVKAGINVRGTLLQPHLSFFSDPPLPQAQIVSLILAGGSLQSAQNQSTAALGQGAALLAAQLGSRVGIPDVTVETDPLANETSLVLGRYLSPRLYVSYGVSLTEQLNTFKLRYTLGDHWTVRTELGQARGADLVYTIEK